MKKSRTLCAFWSAFSTHPITRRKIAIAAVLLAMLMIGWGISTGAVNVLSIFKTFPDDAGTLRSATADATLNVTNKFFDPALGRNGQSCATCHQPFDGFTISTETINDAFVATNGQDPLFRCNDTADNPAASGPTADNYSLFLELGVVRIGKTIPGNSNFRVVAANQATIDKFAAPDVFPLTSDPQQPLNPGDPNVVNCTLSIGASSPTLSLFRRPLVNTNVHLDSSVLWDGRANIANMRAQVIGAARTLLLTDASQALPSNADADNVAAFMLGVFTDQVSDNAAGNLAASGATGGVDNLLAQALACTAGSCAQPSPGTTPVFTLYNAWSGLTPNNAINEARLAIARGELVFNTFGCRGCHNANNLGNNPSATFFPRIGTDSPDILAHLIAGDGVVPGSDPHEHPELQTMLDRINKLPLYCLRPNTDTTPFDGPGGVPCGGDPLNHSGDVRTTDPGRALVTGSIANVGGFKPPILRDLPVRSPYFHAGAADSIEQLIDFYNARFNFGLTAQQKADLAVFLETL